jgi:hypothetical protein
LRPDCHSSALETGGITTSRATCPRLDLRQSDPQSFVQFIPKMRTQGSWVLKLCLLMVLAFKNQLERERVTSACEGAERENISVSSA